MKKFKEKTFQEEVEALSPHQLLEKFDEIAELRRGKDAPHHTVVEAAERYFKKGAKVLDLGAGTGKYVTALAEKGIEVTPVDISRKAHEVIKEEKLERGVKGEQMRADITKLPYRDGSFDGAIFFGTASFMKREKINEALSEIQRVLKPGGVLIAGFPSTSSDIYELNRSFRDNSKTVKVLDRQLMFGDVPLNFFDKNDFEEYAKIIERNFKIIEKKHEISSLFLEGAHYMSHWNWILIAQKL
ncbi:MAG: methyltransferase domain-containing protein [Candidatus Micrarchaeia archaeon]